MVVYISHRGRSELLHNEQYSYPQSNMVASSNTSAPSICIFGATGSQGGSVLNHLLKSDKPYRIRAVTRDPTKPKSKSLISQGVEVVKAELGSQSDVEAVIQNQDLVFVSSQDLCFKSAQSTEV
jgi:putative NADH-flavin reductase